MKNSRWQASVRVGVTLSTLLIFTLTSFAQNMFRKVNDFDGDGKSDYAITRNEGGLKIWYVWQSTAGFARVHWGLSSDVDASGDYDGDGKTDFAVFRGPTGFPSLHRFYVLESQTGNMAYKEFSTLGNFGSFPMHQDYNGDGRTDFAVWLGQFTQSTSILISYSATGQGASTQIPVSNTAIRIGDTDGDGRSDKAHYTNSGNVLTTVNLDTQQTRTTPFGAAGDQYIAADFDGDGIGDLAIFRSSDATWWWLRSSDNVVNVANWGQSGDAPVAGDYDGDGKTDIATYRPGSPQSHYWVSLSTGGVSVFAWGISSDTPVRY